eukprot:gb/GECG01006334.1/.p1 GENE.gb/GECG01006334.1/~~gb/GECG01006334.1/.p1  ORF type:complete len:122 (+),score=27.92 gb/GECG01006334.1/:1-366(+)
MMEMTAEYSVRMALLLFFDDTAWRRLDAGNGAGGNDEYYEWEEADSMPSYGFDFDDEDDESLVESDGYRTAEDMPVLDLEFPADYRGLTPLMDIVGFPRAGRRGRDDDEDDEIDADSSNDS